MRLRAFLRVQVTYDIVTGAKTWAKLCQQRADVAARILRDLQLDDSPLIGGDSFARLSGRVWRRFHSASQPLGA